MIDIPKHVESRRSSYNSLPRIVRGFIVAIAFVFGGIGLILSFTPPPFFDLGVILLLLSLSVLSFQFKWAQSVLVYITKKLADKTFRKKLLAGIGILFIAVASLAVYWLFIK